MKWNTSILNKENELRYFGVNILRRLARNHLEVAHLMTQYISWIRQPSSLNAFTTHLWYSVKMEIIAIKLTYLNFLLLSRLPVFLPLKADVTYLGILSLSSYFSFNVRTSPSLSRRSLPDIWLPFTSYTLNVFNTPQNRISDISRSLL